MAPSPITADAPIQRAGLPDPGESRLLYSPHGRDETGSDRLAREIVDAHRQGKEKRRLRDLTAEKYLMHIDGEGDAQWADILDGTRVWVPPAVTGGLRLQHNLLRPLVENAIAYHTAQEYQVLAQAGFGREARDRARVDTIMANSTIQRTKLNTIVAEALFFAAAYGHCPVHSTWREDLRSESYEPIYDFSAQQQTDMLREILGSEALEQIPPEMLEEIFQLRRGFAEVWCGDPWSTVYNEGAKRSSVQWYSYERTLPITLVHQAFEHLPHAQELQGRTDLPSASRYQRIVRRWVERNLGTHGTSGVFGGGSEGDELIGLVHQEVHPGVLRGWPDGRLTIVALDGASEADAAATGTHRGRPVLLHEGPLPGARPSATRFYMSTRGDDVLGKPYVADLDDLQVQLNQLITLEAEFIRRYARPPLLVGPGGLVDDTVTTEDDAILEVAGDSGIQPQFMFPPPQGINIFSGAIERTMDQIFRLGGWQAASRGESRAGDAAAKVVALMKADDTIFGPVNQGIRKSVVELLQTCHALAREYMLLPQDVTTVTGDDLAYLAEPYIDRDQLSPEPPELIVVSGYGATPEHTGQQLLELVGRSGADGQPLMPTEEFWRRYPDHTLRPPEVSAHQLRRAKTSRVNYLIQKLGDALTEQMQDDAHLALPYAMQRIMQVFPPERTDNPQAHIEALDLLVQDPDENDLVRHLARQRQMVFFEILQQQAQAAAQAASGEQEESQPSRPRRQPQGGGGGGGRTTNAMTPMESRQGQGAVSDVRSLTQQAMRGDVR
jgi:hypothetical protein